MSEMNQGNAERVIGAAISVPINIINGLTDLLISKGVISRVEAVDLLQRLIASVQPSEDSEMLKDLLRMALDGLQT